ncbi:MAG TPA: hypothetical protein VMW40_00390 [Candidatus Bathyarchaeia archaeon]|nr:hypothetical protein [Candidatus Bathyarchaeia archaeon]
MKKKPVFPYMDFILSIFSAFVGAYFAWYVIGADRSPLDFLIFLACFSLGSFLVSLRLAKRRKKILSDERIDKIHDDDESARNGFIVVCIGLVALSIFAPEPSKLVSFSVLAVGISVFIISSIVYDKRGNAKEKAGR